MSCNNGGTHINQTFILTGITDVFVTGGTLTNGTVTFRNNTGGTFTVTGFTNPDLNITGGTADNSNKTYIFNNNTGGTFTVVALTDITVTGGTISTGGTATFTNNTGGTFSVTGFSTGTSFTITNNVIPKGSGSTISNGTWAFSGTTLYPLTDSSNIGMSGTNRVNTIFLASNLDYSNNLIFKSGGTETARFSGKFLGINSTGTTGYITIGNNDTPPLSSSTISVGNDPLGVGYDSFDNRIYVANQTAGSVSVINCNTNIVTNTLTVGNGPSYIAYDSFHNRMYVGDQATNIVTPIDCSTNVVGAPITMSDLQYGILYNDNNKKIYAITLNGSVEVIDTLTNTVTGSISVGNTPLFGAYNNIDNTIYIANNGDTTVSVIDCDTDIVITAITTDSGPYAIAYNSFNNTMYLTYSNGIVSIIDCASNTITGSTISTAIDVLSIVYEPINNRMYLTHVSDIITVIDCDTNSVFKTYNLASGAFPQTMGYNSLNQRMYISQTSLDNVLPLSTLYNQNTSLVINSSGNDEFTNALTINNFDGDSILTVRNDRKLVYTDGNEGDNKIMSSDSNGVISLVHLSSITSGFVYTTKVSVSSAQLLALNGTPVDLIPSPGPNKFIDLLSCTASLVYSSTTYNSIALNIKYSANQQVIFSVPAAFMARTSSTMAKLVTGVYTSNLGVVPDTPITLSSGGAVTTGNGRLDIYLDYVIRDV